MVFSSLLFVYIFLPINLLCYAVISDIKKKNICILFFSLIFYAWSSPAYLLIMMVSAFVSYIGAVAIDKFTKDEENPKHLRNRNLALGFTVAANLLILGVFKYTGFLCEIFNYFTGLPKVIPEIILPVGISFYTFQLVSYVVDVYRGEIEAEHNYGRVLLYASLFHQCIAGPIVRYKDIADDLKERKTNITSMNDGISRFCVGLAKKTILANTCASIIKDILPDEATASLASQVTVLGAWITCILYMIYIYLDFSAYSDMAIGLGKMTGFQYKENFNYPYISKSVTEFWRRWHISLSTFFRDYLYIPLGGNRCGIKRQIFNMFVVWALTGLWHGASFNFILWGLYFFVFLCIEKLFLLKLFDKIGNIAKAVIGRIYTLIVVFFGWILFRFEDFAVIKELVKSLFGLNGNAFTNLETNTIILNNFIFFIVVIIAVTPAVKMLANKIRSFGVNKEVAFVYFYNVLNVVIPVVLLFLSTVCLIGNSYNPFIYFRF